MRLAFASGLALWAGTTLLLSEMRWFARTPLTTRLRPYVPGDIDDRMSRGLLSVESFRDVVTPLAWAVGERLASVFGVAEDAGLRLRRIHSPLDPSQFRVAQLGSAVAGFGVAALASVALSLPAPLTLFAVGGAPLLAFLMREQQLASAASKWQHRLVRELPVVSEQLAMLLSSGYSLSATLNRIADRGSGCCALDLRRVCNRMGQGVPDVAALDEWAEIARVVAVDRLVSVLAMNREARNIGRLLSEEARQIRRDLHRDLVETMERRSQQVWIPVTVATLVPGVIFLAVPFIEALRLFAEP